MKYIIIFLLSVIAIQSTLLYRYANTETKELKVTINAMQKENEKASKAQSNAVISKLKSEKQSSNRNEKIRKAKDKCSNIIIPSDAFKQLYEHARRIHKSAFT